MANHFSNEELFEACRSGDVEAVRRALDDGADVNAEFDGFTLISSAAEANQEKVVKLLIARGAIVFHSPSGPDDALLCPLRRALANGRLSIVKLLLDAGASFRRTWHRDIFPLSVAFSSSMELFEFLVANHMADMADGAADFLRTLNSDEDEERARNGMRIVVNHNSAEFIIHGLVSLLRRDYRYGDEQLKGRLALMFCDATFEKYSSNAMLANVDYCKHTSRGRTLLHMMARYTGRKQDAIRAAMFLLIETFPSAVAAMNQPDLFTAYGLDYLYAGGGYSAGAQQEMVADRGLKHSFTGAREHMPALYAALLGEKEEGAAAASAVHSSVLSQFTSAQQRTLITTRDAFGLTALHRAAILPSCGADDVLQCLLSVCEPDDLMMRSDAKIRAAYLCSNGGGSRTLLRCLTPLGAAVVGTHNQLVNFMQGEWPEASAWQAFAQSYLTKLQLLLGLRNGGDSVHHPPPLASGPNQTLDLGCRGFGSLFSAAVSVWTCADDRLRMEQRLALVEAIIRLFLQAGLDPHRRDGSYRTPFSIVADMAFHAFEEEDMGSRDYERLLALLQAMWEKGGSDAIASGYTPRDVGLAVDYSSAYHHDVDLENREDGGHVQLRTQLLRNMPRGLFGHELDGMGDYDMFIVRPDMSDFSMHLPVMSELLTAVRDEMVRPSSADALRHASALVPTAQALLALPSLPDGRPLCSCCVCASPEDTERVQAQAHSYVTSYFAMHEAPAEGPPGNMLISAMSSSAISIGSLAAVFPAIVHAVATAGFGCRDDDGGSMGCVDEDAAVHLWGRAVDMAVILGDVNAFSVLLQVARRRVADADEMACYYDFISVTQSTEDNCWEKMTKALACSVVTTTTEPAWEILRLVLQASHCERYDETGTPQPRDHAIWTDPAARFTEGPPWLASVALSHVGSNAAIQAVVAAGADLRRWEGYHALDTALLEGRVESALLLAEAGASPLWHIDHSLRSQPQKKQLEAAREAIRQGSAEPHVIGLICGTYDLQLEVIRERPCKQTIAHLCAVLAESGWARRKWMIALREVVKE